MENAICWGKFHCNHKPQGKNKKSGTKQCGEFEIWFKHRKDESSAGGTDTGNSCYGADKRTSHRRGKELIGIDEIKRSLEPVRDSKENKGDVGEKKTCLGKAKYAEKTKRHCDERCG